QYRSCRRCRFPACPDHSNVRASHTEQDRSVENRCQSLNPTYRECRLSSSKDCRQPPAPISKHPIVRTDKGCRQSVCLSSAVRHPSSDKSPASLRRCTKCARHTSRTSDSRCPISQKSSHLVLHDRRYLHILRTCLDQAMNRCRASTLSCARNQPALSCRETSCWFESHLERCVLLPMCRRC